MIVHQLKIRRHWFQLQLDGVKSFEVRVDDRGFDVGDRLHLLEITDGPLFEFTGRELLVDVVCLVDDSVPGIKRGYVVMGTRHV